MCHLNYLQEERNEYLLKAVVDLTSALYWLEDTERVIDPDSKPFLIQIVNQIEQTQTQIRKLVLQ